MVPIQCVIATCEPFFRQGMPLAPDDVLLAQALDDLGVQVEIVPWEREEYHWERPDIVVIRSTWNAHLNPHDYLSWAQRVETTSVLCNPLPVICWNLEKGSYFAQLESKGVPVLPFLHIPQSQRVNLAHLLDEKGWMKAVLKPSISANSYATLLVEREKRESLALGQKHLEYYLDERDMLVQPYLASIETSGETNHVFIDGVWSHAFTKVPFRVRTANAPAPSEEKSVLHPTPAEMELATQVVAAAEQLLGIPLLFARVDIVCGNDGKPRLLELEINEPMLHLEFGEACMLLAHAIVSRCTNARHFGGEHE